MDPAKSGQLVLDDPTSCPRSHFHSIRSFSAPPCSASLTRALCNRPTDFSLVLLQVLGLEQFSEVAHDRGSSHGSSRIIRLQYHEHPDYVPLLHRAYKLWRDLEADSGKVRIDTVTLVLASSNSLFCVPVKASLTMMRMTASLLTVCRIPHCRPCCI